MEAWGECSRRDVIFCVILYGSISNARATHNQSIWQKTLQWGQGQLGLGSAPMWARRGPHSSVLSRGKALLLWWCGSWMDLLGLHLGTSIAQLSHTYLQIQPILYTKWSLSYNHTQACTHTDTHTHTQMHAPTLTQKNSKKYRF